MRTRVKICGFTRAEDALTAAYLGADAIGLVFYAQSPRNVDIAAAQNIVKALPAFTSVVALFVDEQPQRIHEVLRQVPVDLLQFHGDEAPEACRLYGKPYIKAVRMHSETDVAALAKRYADAAGILLDAYHPDMQGGSGKRFDWNLIPRHCTLPVILAGGLEAKNVQRAVRQVKPYALDVSSGVESAKGFKDAGKMAALLKEVYACDRQQ
ncbi:MAG: phosphoribosylanthranilate isomerase [Gammaproteobacteria bacterium]